MTKPMFLVAFDPTLPGTAFAALNIQMSTEEDIQDAKERWKKLGADIKTMDGEAMHKAMSGWDAKKSRLTKYS